VPAARPLARRRLRPGRHHPAPAHLDRRPFLCKGTTPSPSSRASGAPPRPSNTRSCSFLRCLALCFAIILLPWRELRNIYLSTLPITIKTSQRHHNIPVGTATITVRTAILDLGRLLLEGEPGAHHPRYNNLWTVLLAAHGGYLAHVFRVITYAVLSASLYS
jgi:hypothetical protein